jgi:hypothetical protein
VCGGDHDDDYDGTEGNDCKMSDDDANLDADIDDDDDDDDNDGDS